MKARMDGQLGEARTVFAVRLARSERRALRAAASRAQEPLGTWIRRVALAAAEEETNR